MYRISFPFMCLDVNIETLLLLEQRRVELVHELIPYFVISEKQ